MAIGAFLAEAVGEGLVYKMLGQIWKMASGIFTKEIGKKATEKIKEAIHSINPKGLEDEHFFEMDLIEADLKPAQRKIVEDGVLFAEAYDKKNGTRSAINFRIIVTIRDKEVGLPQRPGIKILEKIGQNCGSAEAVFAAIQIMGAMHDPAFSVQNMMHLAKTCWIPFLMARVTAIDDRMKTWAGEIGAEQAREIARAEEIADMPSGAKKLFAGLAFNVGKYIKN